MSTTSSSGLLPEAITRLVPRWDCASGRLVGAAVRASRPMPAAALLAAAQRLADDLLRRGTPLPLGVAAAADDLCDPPTWRRLEGWSLARGGAHGLMRVEVPIDGLHTLPRRLRRGLADLGYDIVPAGIDGPERVAGDLSARQIVLAPELMQHVPFDAAATWSVERVMARARASAIDVVIEGVRDEAAIGWLGRRAGGATWSPIETLDRAGLVALLDARSVANDGPPFRVAVPSRLELTWV